jgi:tetratricopeptide (TPR) repeat protein
VRTFEGDKRYERLGLAYPLAIPSRVYLTWGLCELGRFDEARAAARSCVDLANAVANPFAFATAAWAQGHLYLRLEEGDESIHVLERAVNLCRELNLRSSYPWNLGYLATAYIRSGRVETGISLLREAVATAEEIGLLVRQPLTLGLLSHALLKQGKIRDAQNYADKALALARQYHEHGHEAWMLFLHGCIRAEVDEVEASQCEQLFRRAIRIGTRLSMKPLVARSHHELAKALAKMGRKLPEWRSHAAIALGMYNDMQMGTWARRATEDFDRF